MKRVVSFLLAGILFFSLCGCKKSEDLLAAEAAVQAIGEVTINSGELIDKAEAAVEELSDEDREKFKMEDELQSSTDNNNLILPVWISQRRIC